MNYPVAYPIAQIARLGLTKRQAIRECQNIARELEYRMERAIRCPWANGKTWAMDSGSNRSLACEAFAHSIVHGAKA